MLTQSYGISRTLWLCDDGSTNGTFLRNGDFVVPLIPGEPAQLNHMDEFIVGETVVVFREDEPTQEWLDSSRGQRLASEIRDARTLPRKPRLPTESATDPDWSSEHRFE